MPYVSDWLGTHPGSSLARPILLLDVPVTTLQFLISSTFVSLHGHFIVEGSGGSRSSSWLGGGSGGGGHSWFSSRRGEGSGGGQLDGHVGMRELGRSQDESKEYRRLHDLRNVYEKAKGRWPRAGIAK